MAWSGSLLKVSPLVADRPTSTYHQENRMTAAQRDAWINEILGAEVVTTSHGGLTESEVDLDLLLDRLLKTGAGT